MRRYSSRYRFSSLAELNVTPMLDLAFVLLIIFMITAPFLAERADLILPTSKARRDVIDPNLVITIGVDRTEALELNGVPMEKDALGQELARLRTERPALTVVVRGHRELTLQQLTAVLDFLKVNGITDIGILTKPGSDMETP